jgi:hypothetical protein
MDVYIDDDPIADIMSLIAATAMHKAVPRNPDMILCEWID